MTEIRTKYRYDQADGVSPPDLSKDFTYAQHIVHARGKRSQLTSVSLDPNRIRCFGPALYRLEHQLAIDDGHDLVRHDALLATLRTQAKTGEKAERALALQALRHAKRRREALVEWNFDISGVDRKDLIRWAQVQIQRFFHREG